MTIFIALIDQVAIGIYFLIAAAVLFAVRRYLIYGEEFRASYFELERDLSRYRRSNAVTAIILLLELAIIVAGVQAVVVPELLREREIQELVSRSGTEESGFSTPVPLQPVSDLGIDPVALPRSAEVSGQIQATPLPTPTAVGTIIPADPPLGCDSPEARILVPGNGMRVFQPIPVSGTAFTDQFSYASIEISGPSTFGTFQRIDDQTQEVREIGEFSQFSPAGYEAGEYEFRLMVYDITNTLKASCQIHIYVSDPLPTLTPVS